ncbi:MAG: hypothetical protein ACQKBW_13645 [Puniceicoccales bacterium]
MIPNRPLVLRSNRFLGSALIERGLLKNEDLEAANERLLEAIQKGDARTANLLNILLYDLRNLEEADLIDSIMEDEGIGIIDLANYDLAFLKDSKVDIDLCWATYTVPFDQVEGFTMIATAYYLSKPAMTFWEEQFPGPVLWYVCSVGSIAESLERFISENPPEEAEAEKS